MTPATDTVGRVDPAALDAAIDEINAVMRSHAGHIALETVSDDGLVTVRFEAFCTGCPYRPATLYATVRPLLRRVPGVVEVEAYGTAVSEAAARRFKALGFGLDIPVRHDTTTKGGAA